MNRQAGDLVKLIFGIRTVNEKGEREYHIERMWVRITELHHGIYAGELDNDPYCTNDISSGMRVVFEPRHIIAIYDPSSNP